MIVVENIFLTGIKFLVVISTFKAWLVVLIVIAMIFVAFRFFKSGLTGSEARNDTLLRQLHLLQQQIEYTSREEIKAREEAEKAVNQRDKLLSSLSHEIRTPMNGILGMTFLLEETTLTAEQREYINTITSSGKIMLNKVSEVMMNDMLDHSKINIVAAGLAYKPIEIKNCIEDVLDLFAAKAAETRTDLLYEIATDAPTQIAADDKRLKQVLINLVENVLATTQQQQVFVGVHFLKNHLQQITNIAFEVGDKRIGEMSEVIYQLSNGSILEENMGDSAHAKVLELAIIKRLIEEIGGQIKTTTDATTNFIFTIPFSMANEPAEPAMEYTMKGFEGNAVLIVTNNVTASGVIKNLVAQWKLKPAIAFSGKRALDMLAKNHFDLVITDMDMEELNGIELAKLIRSTYADMPVVLLNHINDDTYKQHEEIFGEISVVSKPVKQHALFDNVLIALRHIKNGNNRPDVSLKKLSADFSKQYPLRILIAEDNPVNQKWASKILNKMGYTPDIADNGHVVLDKVGQSHYDIILMDVQMPEMDGIEATKMIRVCLERQPVIIAMTANVMQGDRLACMKAGMDDYISKPVELAALLNMLEKWGLVIKEKKQVLQ